ncbi:MAG: M28 family peptidase [Bacteroidales bacterium]|nr:M28 family peptidase [Bacteroidales bacterium]
MKKSIISLLLALFPILAAGQGFSSYEGLLTEKSLMNVVSFMADDQNTGRASGTPGNTRAEQFITSRFRQLGLKPINWTYTSSFLNRGIILRNVVGLIPASRPSDEYIIVTAHYDHLGEIKGTIYNGADDNASGVAAMLGLAEMYSKMKADGRGPLKNIIFVAFDGKELNLAGSKHFVKHLPVPAKKVIAAINMDIMGTDLVPTGKNREYLMAIDGGSMPSWCQSQLRRLCLRSDYRMDISFDFYGSEKFTRMVYRDGDHNSFVAAGIPAVFFTSGFHQHTLKASDDTDIIDFPLLRKRTLVIFNYINNLFYL